MVAITVKSAFIGTAVLTSVLLLSGSVYYIALTPVEKDISKVTESSYAPGSFDHASAAGAVPEVKKPTPSDSDTEESRRSGGGGGGGGNIVRRRSTPRAPNAARPQPNPNAPVPPPMMNNGNGPAQPNPSAPVPPPMMNNGNGPAQPNPNAPVPPPMMNNGNGPAQPNPNDLVY